MDANAAAGLPAAHSKQVHFGAPRLTWWLPRTIERCRAVLTHKFVVQLAIVFVAYYVAGKLGQATTNIRSGNLGPVWPAYGIALAAMLAYGYRVWPGVMASAFLVAVQSPVSPLTALGQAAGATVAAASGTFFLRGVGEFDPALVRLRDALALIVLGAFGSALVSASIGIASLYATGQQPYSGLPSAWLIYWLGDATGVLLVTPLVFALPTLWSIRSQARLVELAALLLLLTLACFIVFGDLPLFPIRLHVLAFAVLPFVMWAAIDFGIGGASLSVLLVATIATLLTALGSGPFSANTPLINAILLDVLFAVLAVSGLALAAVVSERERAENERRQLIRAQTAVEAQLRLAAVVESSNDAILSLNLEGIILSWNAAAQRIFGFTAAEAIGQPMTLLIPSERREEDEAILQRLKAGKQIQPYETIGVTNSAKRLNVSVTISALRDAEGRLIGAAKILRDITEHKHAEEALTSVSRRLIEAQERERNRIAGELHDDIGQRIAMLAVSIEGLAADVAGSDGFQDRKADLRRQATEIATDVQTLSHELHSSRLELLGIAATMRHFCVEFADQQRARVDFQTHGVPEHLALDTSLCLFRILQEALHNSAKHSGAGQVAVQLLGTEREIHLVVRDHGRGFDVEAARKGRGIGLVNMEERMRLVDGDFSIESQPSAGTTIHARVRLGPSQSLPPC
jgi:PAS domain S-box-containing protein